MKNLLNRRELTSSALCAIGTLFALPTLNCKSNHGTKDAKKLGFDQGIKWCWYDENWIVMRASYSLPFISADTPEVWETRQDGPSTPCRTFSIVESSPSLDAKLLINQRAWKCGKHYFIVQENGDVLTATLDHSWGGVLGAWSCVHDVLARYGYMWASRDLRSAANMEKEALARYRLIAERGF